MSKGIDSITHEAWIETAIRAAIAAGAEILSVYETTFDVELKDDRTPLTIADKKAHKVIVEKLQSTALPVLSEEGREIPYSERKKWTRFWMVDPLDGTKEFIKRNGEFTVNIALIENGRAVSGVIYVPVLRDLYFALSGNGAFKIQNPDISFFSIRDLMTESNKLPFPQKQNRPFTVVGSRSHQSPDTKKYMEELQQRHGKIEIVSMGSSLKICLVAAGDADIYPRFAPTMEWDTAAGHAIAKEAGKEIYDHTTGKPMVYNKENLLNNWFIVS